jgi:D-alanyl-D-alanine carboxypeptidase
MRTNLGRRCAVTILTAALLAGTVGPAAAVAAQPATVPAGPAALLPTAVQDLHELGISGVQGLTRVDGRTRQARAGVGDLERRTPVPVDGCFRMGSNTKTFTAVVVLQLVGEGRLTLDDTVERWLPGVVAGNGNDGRRITVRQLLQHTSGIYNYTNDLAAFADKDAFLAHRFDHYSAADIVALAMRHQPGFDPGASWDYSNTNYILAGMIIEKVTGHSWAAEVRSRILRPLALRETVEPGDRPSLPGPHARGYQQWAAGGELTDTTEFNPSVAGAAGSLITTPSDLARFWQALQRGQLLKPRQMAQMHETVPAVTFQDYVPGGRYGLGIMFVPNRCGGYWAHGGDVPGMSTANGVSPRGDRVAVLSLTTQLADEEAALTVQRRAAHLVDEVICG